MALGDGTTVTIETSGATTVDHDLTWTRSVLQFLANPNLAFLLLSIGTLGIVYELASPGIGAGGGVGVVLILLGLVSLSVLSVDAAGPLFLVLAAGLFVAELFAPGVGVAAALGAVALVLAAIFTFSDDTPGLSLSLAAVVPTAVVMGLAVVLACRLALRARNTPPATGVNHLVGREVVVQRVGEESAQARVDGSWWTLRADRTPEVGDRVRVTDVEGIALRVEQIAETEEQT